jgi:hypothetical protein
MNLNVLNAKTKASLLSCALAFSVLSTNNANAVPGGMTPDQGKLLATHGVSSIDGAGGGGLTPWALITGGGTKDSWGANAHYSFLNLPNYQVAAQGLAIGLFDRVEFSYTQHALKGTDGPLDGLNIDQEIFGAKLKLFGDAIYDQDSWIPQVAVGALYHRHGGFKSRTTPVIGNGPIFGDISSLAEEPEDPVSYSRNNDGLELYIAATKVFLAQSILANVTLRRTKANQFGLLGFGGAGSGGDNDYELMLEGSLAYLVRKDFAVGVEYRQKPNNLENLSSDHPLAGAGLDSMDAEEDAWDVFAVWFPNKNVSLTAAWVDLGVILDPGQTFLGDSSPKKQRGAYLSVQVGF